MNHSIIMLHWYRMTCFEQFFVLSSSFAHRIDFLLHVLIVPNATHVLAMISLIATHVLAMISLIFVSRSLNNHVIFIQNDLL